MARNNQKPSGAIRASEPPTSAAWAKAALAMDLPGLKAALAADPGLWIDQPVSVVGDQTALIMAAMAADAEAAQWLLEQGADASHRNAIGMHAMWACMDTTETATTRRTECLRLLRKATPPGETVFELTPMEVAISRPNAQWLSILLEGEDPRMPTSEGVSLLTHATREASRRGQAHLERADAMLCVATLIPLSDLKDRGALDVSLSALDAAERAGDAELCDWLASAEGDPESMRRCHKRFGEAEMPRVSHALAELERGEIEQAVSAGAAPAQGLAQNGELLGQTAESNAKNGAQSERPNRKPKAL
jgi:ankyrin repeat protein